MFNLTYDGNDPPAYPNCTFGPDMSADFHYSPWNMTSSYLVILPILLSVFLLGKVDEGKRLCFVYTIIALTIVNNSADVLFHSTFICQPDDGPTQTDPLNPLIPTPKYANWNLMYSIAYVLSNVIKY